MRNERDHRLWPILLHHHHKDTYWTHFSQDTCLLNNLTQKWHFSDTQIRREWTLFETCLCLNNTFLIWEPVLPALLRNRHKQTFKWSFGWNHGLKVKTHMKQISCNAKSICFNQFTRRYNTPRQGRGMIVVTNCLHGRCDSAHLGDRKCLYHFTPLAQPRVGDLLLIIDNLWYNYQCGLLEVTHHRW